MRLFFALLWLGLAAALFGHGLATGKWPFVIRGLDLSAGWLFLLMGLYNLAHVYAARARRAERALRAEHDALHRRAPPRPRTFEYDPNFDFSDKPAPPPPG